MRRAHLNSTTRDWSPKSEIRNPNLAELEPNKGMSNRGIHGKTLLGGLVSAYSAYSAVCEWQPFCVQLKEDEAKPEANPKSHHETHEIHETLLVLLSCLACVS